MWKGVRSPVILLADVTGPIGLGARVVGEIDVAVEFVGACRHCGQSKGRLAG
jgi:hypothetical protein